MSVLKTHLTAFPFFKSLPPQDLDRVARAATRQTFPARTLLFSEGAHGDRFYMIVSGMVEILSGSAENETQLNLLGAGAWFGELALLDNHPRSASARTVKRSVLITLPKQEFLWLVTTYPLALFQIVSGIQEMLRERTEAYRVEAELRAAQLEKLYSTALDITRHREPLQALNDIREHAVDLLASAGGDLYLLDKTATMLIPHASDLQTRPLRVGEGCAGRAFASGAPCIARPNARSPMYELAAPIRLDARSIGVLNVYRASDGAPYQEPDQTLLELFASQAAIVIENAELNAMQIEKARLDGELSAARLVQRSLIPNRPPRIAGYELAALWEPARQVSGDFYDFIPLPEGRMGLVIADVSDKGTPAALFMASARSILRASVELGGSVASMVARANRAIANDSARGMFITVFLGILDPSAHTFAYVNAGHNPPLLVRAENDVAELSGGNYALGILDDATFAASEIVLRHGDLVLMYTDGVTEASDADNELFGEERLHALARTLPDTDAVNVISRLDAQVREFTGATPQSDDITAVALKRN